MSDDTTTAATGITRREALKRGAALGGALVWAAPIVQTVGMRAAYAQSTSPECPNLYCLKAEVQGGSLGNFAPYDAGQGKGQGNCLKPNDDCDPNVPAAILNWLNDPANRSGSLNGMFTITLPPGCTLADDMEFGTGSPDLFFGGASAVAKCGRRRGTNPCFPADDGNLPDLKFQCGNRTGISHIELIICCP